jgi:hypothetical protein
MHWNESVTPDEALPTPDTDPEFWERPARTPPYLVHEEAHHYYNLVYALDGLMYRGDTAINLRTKTLYHWTGCGWTTTPPNEEDQ